MLRLEKLELAGFKSFFSRTEFHLDRSITAVVGPNGCGKSNIGDALNWVIGEQSVKSLRGGRMEDVIFNGSEGRKPLGMAEVSLHMRNGTSEGEDEQIVLTRRLFRSGESEYLINGQRSRLKDLQEKLAQINVGSGVYSIIEQGKVDAALSSRPRDRRVLIEEAAGIAIYKARKRQAETKLEATEANLARVNDIISELERQIRSLKRQAARARRYGRLNEEISRHERILFYHDHRGLQGDHKALQEREASARAGESSAAARLAGIESAYEEARRGLDEKEALWRQRRDELHSLQREIDRHEREIVLAREQAREAGAGVETCLAQAEALAGKIGENEARIEARKTDRHGIEDEISGQDAERARLEEVRYGHEQRILSLESEMSAARSAFLEAVDALSDARNRRRQIEELLDKLGRQQGSLDAEAMQAAEELRSRQEARAEIDRQLAAAESAAASMRSDLAVQREELARLESVLEQEGDERERTDRRLHGHEERLRALEEIEAGSLDIREVLAGAIPHEGILSESLTVPARLEAAVETYLGSMLEAAVVRDAEAAFDGISTLKASGKGRAAFLPLSAGAGGEDPSPRVALPSEVRESESFVGRLSELIEAPETHAGPLSAALQRAVVVNDLATAAWARRQAPWFDYLTLDGDILRTNGIVEGGARRPEGSGALSRRRLMSDLVTRIQQDRDQVRQIDRRLESLKAEREAAARGMNDLAEKLSLRDKELVALRLKAQGASEEEERDRTKVDTIGRERLAALEEARSLAEEKETLIVRISGLEESRAREEAGIQARQEEIAGLRSASASVGDALATVRAALSASRQKLESLDLDLSRLLETDQDLRDRQERESARVTELQQRQADAQRRETDSASALQELSVRHAGLESTVKEEEVQLGELRIEIDKQTQQLRAARGVLEEARTAREGVTLELERVTSSLRHLVSAALAESGRTLDEYLASVTDEEKGLEPETVREELGTLKQRRERLGPVNMMALDQFKELEERYEFLSTQRKDLTDAIASLKQTISRINRTSRERFMEAFEHIRVGFGEIYSTLFNGGRADLRLLTGDGEEDVLDCGMEIIAQPPGKRLQSVSLLSGGEKALTAIALIFAIFRYRPSPFCLLDEVDAPLDEANVLRFSQLLKSMSESTQFVLITHNRSSMEAADMLYGVTMNEPGVSRTMSVVLDGNPRRGETIKTLPAVLASQHKSAPASA